MSHIRRGVKQWASGRFRFVICAFLLMASPSVLGFVQVDGIGRQKRTRQAARAFPDGRIGCLLFRKAVEPPYAETYGTTILWLRIWRSESRCRIGCGQLLGPRHSRWQSRLAGCASSAQNDDAPRNSVESTPDRSVASKRHPHACVHSRALACTIPSVCLEARMSLRTLLAILRS